jgi:hypothetical protein
LNRILLASLAFITAAAAAQQPTPALVRLHGTIEKADVTSLVIRERDGREITLRYAERFVVSEVAPIDPSAIQTGNFVGTTAVPGPDGTLSAVEVHVFAESARGTGEGHRPMDILPNATMTNATVTAITQGANDRTMVLHYKDGEKTIHVPNGVPVVTQNPGDRSLLVPGAKVTVFEQMQDGKAVALRVQVGRNGYTPPT